MGLFMGSSFSQSESAFNTAMSEPMHIVFPYPPSNEPFVCKSYEDVLEMQAVVSQPLWKTHTFCADGNYAAFSFRKTKFLLSHESAALLGGRKVLIIGNSNVGQLMGTIVQLSKSFSTTQSYSDSIYALNTDIVTPWPVWTTAEGRVSSKSVPSQFQVSSKSVPSQFKLLKHSGSIVTTPFDGEQANLTTCPFAPEHAEVLDYKMYKYERAQAGLERKHRFLFCDVCNVTKACESDTSALLAFQFTDTPDFKVQQLMAAAIVGKESYAFIQRDLTDLVFQLQKKADLERILDHIKTSTRSTCASEASGDRRASERMHATTRSIGQPPTEANVSVEFHGMSGS